MFAELDFALRWLPFGGQTNTIHLIWEGGVCHVLMET